MTSANAEDWLTRLFDDREDAGQRLRRVHLPWMTLTAENYVRWTKTANAFERYVLEWFDEDLEAGNQTPKHRANLPRARALTINCVVDQVNEHSHKKAHKAHKNTCHTHL